MSGTPYATTLALLKNKSYRPFFATQFLGAFNDNVFKLAVLTIISFYSNLSENESEKYQALANALFTIPFFLFSATAGQLSDKFNKAIIARCIKGFECFLMALGGIALYFGNIYALMALIGCLGIHSSFFGPVKYSILLELLDKKKLLAGTSLIEASTFMAIFLGTSLGSLSVGHQTVFWAILFTNLIAWLGLLASIFIPIDLPEQRNLSIDWHFLRATYQILRQVLNQPMLLIIIIAISWFWLIGTVVMIKLPDYVRFVLNADNQVFALFLILFSVGIALGSLSVNYFLKGKITMRLAPFGLFCVSLFATDLYFATPESVIIQDHNVLQSLGEFIHSFTNWRIVADFFSLCFSGGVYIVPCYTLLQTKSRAAQRSRTIAANNIINSVFMVLGSLIVMFLLLFNISIQGVLLLILGLLNLVVCIFLWIYQPNQSRAGRKV